MEEMLADPAVAAMAAAGDGSDAPASLSSDPDLADLDLGDLEGEWPVKEDIISERLGEQASVSSSYPTSGDGFCSSASGSVSGSMDLGADADGAMLAAAHKAEAAAKGYGKLYGAFGGGREGLEACAAGKPCWQACHAISASHQEPSSARWQTLRMHFKLPDPSRSYCRSTRCCLVLQVLVFVGLFIAVGATLVHHLQLPCFVCSGCAVRGGRD